MARYTAMGLGRLASWSPMPAILGACRALRNGVLPLLAVGLIAAERAGGL
ncbi:MAG TPA: hypothetical protein VGJ54_00005 [Streptosporangiaceae bacterium]